MKKFCIITVSFLTCVVMSADYVHAGIKIKSTPQPEQKPSRAIVSIGINTYKHVEGLADFEFAVQDANEISRVVAMSESKKYARTKVVLLTNQSARKASIFSSIDKYAPGFDSKNTELYLYMTGYAVESGSDILIYPYIQKKIDKDSVITSAELAAAIAKSNPRRLILMLDMNCSVQIMDTVKSAYKGEIVAIGGSQSGKMVFESRSWKHSALAKEIIEGLAPYGGKETAVDWKEFFLGVSAKVKKLTNNMQEPSVLFSDSAK